MAADPFRQWSLLFDIVLSKGTRGQSIRARYVQHLVESLRIPQRRPEFPLGYYGVEVREPNRRLAPKDDEGDVPHYRPFVHGMQKKRGFFGPCAASKERATVLCGARCTAVR